MDQEGAGKKFHFKTTLTDKNDLFLVQISLTPVQVATDVWQAREYSTWKAHVHTNQRIPIPDS